MIPYLCKWIFLSCFDKKQVSGEWRCGTRREGGLAPGLRTGAMPSRYALPLVLNDGSFRVKQKYFPFNLHVLLFYTVFITYEDIHMY